MSHPSAIGATTIRNRLARLSEAAGARKADGSLLRLRPHDCRRVFASEHLNNNTPPHVIQALLGHGTIDTRHGLRQALPLRADRGLPACAARDLHGRART
ncbi:MAG: tyrosine-type recombinase/integrase [Actinomycetota bacterium]|nr:tyrosine-type recombinase/integrase [Actinomycetota bacterium]